MKKESLAHLPPDEDSFDHHLDQVNYLSYQLKHYELNRHPFLIGRGWEQIKGKCCSFWHVVLATADALQQQLQALSDDDDDDGSNG